MTESRIRNAIVSGWPFFGVTPQGDVLARYVMYGPVFRWSVNQMIPMPLQGSDLLWWMQAAAEEGHSITESLDAAKADTPKPLASSRKKKAL